MHTKRVPPAVWKTGVLFAGVLAAIGAAFFGYNRQKMQKHFSYSDEVFGNPLMGYAPCAWYDTVSDDISLLYVDITWRELEPQEGVFAWEQIEAENQLERWRAEGKHIVLRFVCDLPGEEAHRDIPDWLYEKTGGSGTDYDISYGRGYCPDYSDPQFIACHQKAVAALGERYGRDDFISYIELGSLGHWGEWHIHSGEGLPSMPLQAVRAQYIRHWVEAFPQARILMRRPFAEAADYGLGVFNDMAGHPEDTAEWLDWIQNGGDYDQTGEENALTPLPEGWKTAPVGGEFTSSLPMEQMLDTDLEETVALIRESHTTFLGPKIAEADYPEGYDAVLLHMGYRLWISDLQLCAAVDGVRADLTWQNSGVAPLYAHWPVYLQVVDKDGRIQENAAVDISLNQLLPGQTLQTTTLLQEIRWKNLEDYTLQLVVVDPLTQAPALRFANRETEDCTLVLHKAR